MWNVNFGTSTLITFSVVLSRETFCFGASRAVFEHLILHPGPSQHKILVGRGNACFHLLAQPFVFPDPL